jgi:plastocyanin
MTSAPVRRPLRRLPLALVVAAFGAALVVVPGGPAVAQAKRSVQIDGTAANQWVPANVAIKPGGTVTFRVADGQTHPVGSGATPRRGTSASTTPTASPRSTWPRWGPAAR